MDDIPALLESDIPEAGPSRQLERPKVPITLLTGYLGAGKSTLLEYILTADHGYRIAVCMNDFGDSTDIEARTLTLSDPASQTQSTSFLSLPNGCLCCSVKDMGIAAIEEMVASTPDGVDWVIVELTGIADPAPIAKSFWANEEMGDLILDGVICVVDSRNVTKQLADHPQEGDINECQKQVACADVILLNKIDLVTPEKLREVEAAIASINPTLKVHHTIHSRIPLKALHGLQAFSSTFSETQLVIESTAGRHSQDAKDDHKHDHPHTELQHQISSILIDLPKLSANQYKNLNTFLETLLWESKILHPDSNGEIGTSQTSPAPEILRTKGYIITDGGRYVLQGVADLFELKLLDGGSEDGNSLEQGGGNGKIVFIGKGLNESLRIALSDYLELT